MRRIDRPYLGPPMAGIRHAPGACQTWPIEPRILFAASLPVKGPAASSAQRADRRPTSPRRFGDALPAYIVAVSLALRRSQPQRYGTSQGPHCNGWKQTHSPCGRRGNRTGRLRCLCRRPPIGLAVHVRADPADGCGQASMDRSGPAVTEPSVRNIRQQRVVRGTGVHRDHPAPGHRNYCRRG